MNVIFTVLFAFGIGFFVKQRGLAIVTYLALDAILFTMQTVNVLHDSWLDDQGRVTFTNGASLAYCGANILIIIVGVVLVLVGFAGGAALSASTLGVALLWIAVLAQFLWLALACSQIYAWTPHPLLSKR